MNIVHKLVIAISTASLVLLGFTGSLAHADNMAPLKAKAKAVKPAQQALRDLREKVRIREENDGGCG